MAGRSSERLQAARAEVLARLVATTGKTAPPDEALGLLAGCDARRGTGGWAGCLRVQKGAKPWPAAVLQHYACPPSLVGQRRCVHAVLGRLHARAAGQPAPQYAQVGRRGQDTAVCADVSPRLLGILGCSCQAAALCSVATPAASLPCQRVRRHDGQRLRHRGHALLRCVHGRGGAPAGKGLAGPREAGPHIMRRRCCCMRSQALLACRCPLHPRPRTHPHWRCAEIPCADPPPQNPPQNTHQWAADHQAEAQASGALIVPACGIDFVLADGGALAAAALLPPPGAVREVEAIAGLQGFQLRQASVYTYMCVYIYMGGGGPGRAGEASGGSSPLQCTRGCPISARALPYPALPLADRPPSSTF